MHCDQSNPERSDSLRMVIFAKAPVPGSVKTRLIPALGWRLHVLSPLPDIDRPDDLIYLPGSWTEQSGLSNQRHVHCDGSTGNLA